MHVQVESSGRMCVWLAASPLYGFIPALPALISVDKPCFQSLYILSLVLSRTGADSGGGGGGGGGGGVSLDPPLAPSNE